jgi:hypothetical protein
MVRALINNYKKADCRPWPSCINPETGNEWAHDMKEKVLHILHRIHIQIYRSHSLLFISKSTGFLDFKSAHSRKQWNSNCYSHLLLKLFFNITFVGPVAQERFRFWYIFYYGSQKG